MISPSEQKIIQIDITNVCPHGCANCTRFCGHKKENEYFMTLPYFEMAVNSLRDFPRMVGVMGGEPTLHPRFAEFSEAIGKLRPEPNWKPAEGFIEDFAAWRQKHLSSVNHKRGLWSSLGPGYRKHFEIIQQVYPYQCINDHRHAGEHIALLLPRKELRIPDTDWQRFRDNCWVQRLWSASITPKGAFFCEVAGALDLLFDGPGGWPIKPDWWKRKPEDFGDQLQWCELCSACLPVPKRRATDRADDVAPEIHARLKAMGSTKPMVLFDTTRYDWRNTAANQSPEPYLPEAGNAARISAFKTVQSLHAVVVCDGYDDYLRLTLPDLIPHVDKVVVVTAPRDSRTPELLTAPEFGSVLCCVSPRLEQNGHFHKGKGINDGLAFLEENGAKLDWILHLDADVIVPPSLSSLRTAVLDPGKLHYVRRWGPRLQGHIPALMRDIENGVGRRTLFMRYANPEQAKVEGRQGNAIEHLPFGYFQLFNVAASALRGRATRYPEASASAEHDDMVMGFDWFKGRTVALPSPLYDVIHLPHGNFQENWKGRRSPRLEDVYAEPAKYQSLTSNYVCERSCFFGGRLYAPGEKLETSATNVPNHFRRV